MFRRMGFSAAAAFRSLKGRPLPAFAHRFGTYTVDEADKMIMPLVATSTFTNLVGAI